MPIKRTGLGNSADIYEPFIGLTLLATQPAGNIHALDIPPHSFQSKDKNFDSDSIKLKDGLRHLLTEEEKTALKCHADNKKGGASLKVVFILGKNDAEKDIDNMLKWFMDCFKEVTNADDGVISDLRGMKWRCSSRPKGMIGFSIATVSYKEGGDKGLVQLECVEEAIKRNIKMDNVNNELLDIILNEQQKIQELLNPKFK